MKSLRLLPALATAALIGLAQPALAQKVGPNGGLIAGKAGHETELVVGATELTVYLLDHGKPHPVKGVSMRGVVQQAGANTTVTFEAAADNRMIARLAAPLAKGAIVVLTGKDDHGDAISSRYVVN
jgi:hypothetical protein